MKIRQGFVSNSSSTSFTLYGVEIEDWASAYQLADESGLTSCGGDPDGWPHQSVYVGLVFAGEFEHGQRSDMRDDETKLQFMERVVAALPEEWKKEADWHSESFYNG